MPNVKNKNMLVCNRTQTKGLFDEVAVGVVGIRYVRDIVRIKLAE